MDDRTARTIQTLKDWKQVAQLTSNAQSSGRMTPKIELALHERALELAHEEIVKVTGLDLMELTPAEGKVLRAVKEYLVIKRRAGTNANRTLDQIQRHGFIGAAEISVEKSRPTQGFRELAQASREDISYESIVLQHPEEFSERTLWFARRTLNLPNSADQAPASTSGITQARTEAILHWLQGLAEDNDGILPEFSNADIASAIGLDLQRFGRPQGNIQSRIDFACFQCGLPPLGLAANEPFAEAWRNDKGTWAFPIAGMQAAARSRIWSEDDFQRVLAITRTLQSSAHPLWKEKMATADGEVRAWAFDIAQELSGQGGQRLGGSRPPNWSRDELILALELYLRNPHSPPDKESEEVLELSRLLNRLGQVLGTARGGGFRNANGVYMKMMNFRRFDSQYTNGGRVGLTRGNKDEAIVWSEFSDAPEKLMAVVAAIRTALDQSDNDEIGHPDDEEGIEEAAEGRLLTRLHRTRERSRKLVEQRKKSALRTHGRLFCEACGFDFSQGYGTGAGHIIDCHHTKPVHTLAEGAKTRLEDLALLCANCHRVVHAFRPWLTVEQLRERLSVVRRPDQGSRHR